MRYIDVAEVAKMIRRDLKRRFPYVRFNVRISRFAGGDSIRVRWIDGPAQKVVEALYGSWRSCDFDGTIDMATSRYHWLHPDGSITLARRVGTEGSKGRLPEIRQIAPHDDAELVHLGGNYHDYVRDLSAAYTEALALDVARKWGVDPALIKVDRHDDGTGSLANETCLIQVDRFGDRDFGTLFWQHVKEIEERELERFLAESPETLAAGAR